MKNLILLLAVFVFAAFTVSAQVSSSGKSDADKKEMVQKRQQEQQQLKTEQAATQAENPNAPVIKFDKTVHDYGTMQQHGDGKCEFKFTNEGKEPLILSNVRSSCGCTVPTWPRQPVLPGQSEVIKVKYDTKRIGMINKSIHVYSNSKVSPLTLKIKGKIESPSATKAPTKEVDDVATPVNK